MSLPEREEKRPEEEEGLDLYAITYFVTLSTSAELTWSDYSTMTVLVFHIFSNTALTSQIVLRSLKKYKTK